MNKDEKEVIQGVESGWKFWRDKEQYKETLKGENEYVKHEFSSSTESEEKYWV